jgi:hypothetical protein
MLIGKCGRDWAVTAGPVKAQLRLESEEFE